MPIYTCIMIAIAAATLIAGGLLCAGQYGWLYSFNRSAHKDDKAYSRYLGKSVIGLGVIALASGLIFMALGAIPAVALLIAGALTAFVIIAKDANKHYR